MPTNRVNSISPSILTSPSGRRTVASWCRLRHSRTLQCTSGISSTASRARMALRLARCSCDAAEAAHGEVADVGDEEERRRRQPGVPLPEHAPGQPPPEHPGDQRDAHEQHADLGAGAGQAIPAERVALGEQVDRRGDGGDDERQVGEPCRRHVDVEDAHRLGLVAVGGREAEAEGEQPGDADDRGGAEEAGAACRVPAGRGRWTADPAVESAVREATSSSTPRSADRRPAFPRRRRPRRTRRPRPPRASHP